MKRLRAGTGWDASGIRRGRWLALCLWLGAAQGHAELPAGDAACEAFLARAEVIEVKPIGVGVTQSRRLTLRLDGVQHDAHFQDVEVSKPHLKTVSGVTSNFRDDWRYNIVAYRLDRMLGLGMVPVAIERRIRNRDGALSWWVDDVILMERDRLAKQVRPPDASAWAMQKSRLLLFDSLIDNIDRNLGNVLIDERWKVWLIDHTRAFTRRASPPGLDGLLRCERALLERIRTLERSRLEKELGDLLGRYELDALLRRRDRLVQHFDRLVAENGAEAIFIEAPPEAASAADSR